MIIPLSRPYPCRLGKPVINRVDTAVFELRYFAHCMACTFCNDWCCQFGADVDVANGERLVSIARELEPYLGIPRTEWFDESEFCEDEEAPGDFWWRTAVKENGCVFLNRTGRGCLLHSFSIEKGFDYHEIKPFICSIFPLSYEDGLLIYADEIEDKSLVCAGTGPSLYEGVRKELEYYFGKAFTDELDQLQANVSLQRADAEEPTPGFEPGTY